jgi:hypothetical protein
LVFIQAIVVDAFLILLSPKHLNCLDEEGGLHGLALSLLKEFLGVALPHNEDVDEVPQGDHADVEQSDEEEGESLADAEGDDHASHGNSQQVIEEGHLIPRCFLDRQAIVLKFGRSLVKVLLLSPAETAVGKGSDVSEPELVGDALAENLPDGEDQDVEQEGADGHADEGVEILLGLVESFEVGHQ